MTRLAISVPEAAKAVGIGKTTLKRLLAKGKGPRTVRVGQRRLIRLAELERWLLEREEQPAA